MTARISESHCSHEKVCHDFINGSVVASRDGTKCMRNHDGCKKCDEDTRLELFSSEDNGAFSLPASTHGKFISDEKMKEHDAIVKKKTIEEIMLWRKENRGKKLGYCTNGMIEDQFLTELIDKDSWSIEEHDHLISTQAANEVTIDDFCFIDIFDYTNHGRVADDVGRCKGASCNYCGKFNKFPEDKQLSDEDYAAKVQKE